MPYWIAAIRIACKSPGTVGLPTPRIRYIDCFRRIAAAWGFKTRPMARSLATPLETRALRSIEGSEQRDFDDQPCGSVELA